MKLDFNPTAAFIGAVVSILAGVYIFHTPALAVVFTSALIGIICGLIKWSDS